MDVPTAQSLATPTPMDAPTTANTPSSVNDGQTPPDPPTTREPTAAPAPDDKATKDLQPVSKTKTSVPKRKNKKKKGSEYEQRVLELFDKHQADYERAYFSKNNEFTCGHVITKVVTEAEFQFGFLFDPHRDPKAPPPPLPSLKPYDPLAPIPEPIWSKQDVKTRERTVEKWKKKARNYYYNRVHVVHPDNDKKKPSKVGAALNGLVRPSKARAGYQLFEVENAEELAEEVERQWNGRSQEDVQKDDDEFVRLNEERLAKGLPARTKRSGVSIAFRQKVVWDVYHKLSDEERLDYDLRAKAEAKDKREEYDAMVNKPIVHTPEQRQEAIDNIGTLVSPLIEEIRRHTGLHIIVSAYGPLPSAQGQLGVLTWSAGRNRDAVPVSFLRKCPTAAAAYRERLLAYAATAFTDEDIAAARPSPGSTLASRAQNNAEFELDDDAAIRKGDKRQKDIRERSNGRDDTSGTVEALKDVDGDEVMRPPGSDEVALGNADVAAAVGDQQSHPTLTPATTTPNKRRRRAARPSRGSDSDSDSETDGTDGSGDEEDMDVDSGQESSEAEVDSHPARKKPRLSQIEEEREANIIANRARMEALGLFDAVKSINNSMQKTGTRKKKSRPAGGEQQPRRSSRRLANGSLGGIEDGVQQGASGQPEGPPTETPGATTPIIPPRPTPRQASNKTSSIDSTPSVPTDVPTEKDSPVPEVDREGAGASHPSAAVADMDGVDMDEDAILVEAEELLIEAPPYLSDTLQRMKEKDIGMLGRPWSVFLARLLLLESEGEFNMPMKDLPVGSAKEGTQRPPMLGAWVKSGRCRRNAENVPKDMPLLAPKDLAAHIAAFNAWWGMMQPAWRECKDGKWSRGGYDASVGLGDLNTRGTCGWLSVVACMWWWGVCVYEGEDFSAKRVWDDALADVDWMLTVVLVLGEREGKE
ncbi:hypothetical protein CYLTODRAFT_415352 [Cylindrobasidium torrendii FP15055 ss-10]|uniref:Uncharacterized protein n=1 Tax=Cylindrobasidium torrendii FP15055 ss-10 TaxID=1314674 RepID=A0A0D7AU82_9AGAR|nr:hypothetical protein CYLTODRAFT_415352 [Cylindrobasidium torrendii FP15055 ss-10]